MNALSFDQSLTKYRPDQARDEQGQWTDEGGGIAERQRLSSGSSVNGERDDAARARLQTLRRRLIDGPKKKSDIERLKKDVASYVREMRRVNRASAAAQEWTGKPGATQYSRGMIEAFVQLHAEVSATKPQRTPSDPRAQLATALGVSPTLYDAAFAALSGTPTERERTRDALDRALARATTTHASRVQSLPVRDRRTIADKVLPYMTHRQLGTLARALGVPNEFAAVGNALRAPKRKPKARKAADIQLPVDAINFVRREAKLAATDLVTSLQALPDREKLLVAEALITGFHRVLQDLTKPPPKGKPEKATKYDPNQPRAPSGNPEGGQWTAGGVAGAAASAAATGGGAVLGAAREALSTVTLIPSSKTTVMDALSEWWSRFSALDDRDGKTSMEATVDAAGRIFMTIILGGAMILLANAFLTSAAGAVGAAVGQVLRVLIQR